MEDVNKIMEDVNYEGVFGILSDIKKDVAVIRVDIKAKENQPPNPTVSKEEIDAIVKDKVTTVANYIELRLKQQTENQTKILTEAINGVDKKIENLPVSENVSFPQPKKIAFWGFEFLRTSVVIFILSVVVFWLLVVYIKQMDNYHVMKTKCTQLTEYIHQTQKNEKTEKEKGNRTK